MQPFQHGRDLPPMTEPREYRLRRGVLLVRAAVYAEIPPSRASVIERNPDLARPGELERLRQGVDQAVAERESKADDGPEGFVLRPDRVAHA